MIGSAVLAAFVSFGCSRPSQESPSAPAGGVSRDSATPNPIADASAALRRNDLDAAEAAVRRALVKNPEDAIALELSGDIATLRGEIDRAIAAYQSAMERHEAPPDSLMNKLAISMMKASRAHDCLAVLQQRILQYPQSVEARSEFVDLAVMLGQPELAVPSARWLCQRGHGDADLLRLLIDPRSMKADESFCQQLLQLRPDDQRPAYGLARLDAHKLDWSTASDRLQPLLRRHPNFIAAHMLYGLAIVRLGNFDEVNDWIGSLPADASSSPDYWMVGGEWAQNQDNHAAAARAFWEAIQLDASGYPEALSKLLRSLNALGRDRDADRVKAQVRRHAALRDALEMYYQRWARSQTAAMRVAEQLMGMGRVWEAEGWARHAVALPDDRLEDARQRYMKIRGNLTAQTPWSTAESTLAEQIDLRELPFVDWVTPVASRDAEEPLHSADAPIRLVDQAEQRGLIHTCEVKPSEEEGHWIFHGFAGGLGVLDFDLDGWADLAVSMLDGKPLATDSAPNRLFRNTGGSFVDCTHSARYLDTGFAQGITVGDFNDDGFPDILDANVGRNRLFRNNGDGTFSEVSLEVGMGGEVWTTSAAIGDIDGDGFADIFATNYCGGTSPFQQPCHDGALLVTCPPLKFEAEKDQVWRAVGDGTFVNATDPWMQQTSPGRGLGVLVGAFDEQPGLDLYVANDMTVNHLWSARHDDESFQLVDVGAICGLGFNERAMSQASMGMTAGDPDRDGDIDFFVTHFSDDHNTFYQQVGPGLWADRSYEVGLSEPSMTQLGFGTEWVDFDNDGLVELIVANGHIDNMEQTGVQFRMRPQLFRQRRDHGFWKELPSEMLGPYFEEHHLGRALATIDVNRDGRTDVAVSHLYEPVALLINRTETGNDALTFELKSTSGHRDAIGAVVTATVGDLTWSSQLTAGDGFMCSNQRRISIGMGHIKEAVDVTVAWPSGREESFGTLASGFDHLLVEGCGEAYQLDRHR